MIQKLGRYLGVTLVGICIAGLGFFAYQNHDREFGQDVFYTHIDAFVWNIFEEYLDAAYAQDRDRLRMYSYQLSSVCEGETVSEECKARMETAYTIGSEFDRDLFTVRYGDRNQAILATTPKQYEDENTAGYTQQYLLFAKKADGRFAVLGMDPERSWFTIKNGSSTEELLKSAQQEMQDTDKDGAPDNFENCEFPETFLIVDCEKTDPLVRDTDLDGWWDGIEPFLLPR